MTPAESIRKAEAAFQWFGDERHLDRLTLLAAELPEPVGTATAVWALVLRHDRSGDDATLDAALSRLADGSPAVLPALLRRWWREGEPADLDRAIHAGYAATSERTTGEAAQVPLWLTPAWRTAELATALVERYRYRGSDRDLTDAWQLVTAVGLRGVGPVPRSLILQSRAVLEHERYLREGRTRFLRRAIRYYRELLDRLPATAVRRPMVLTELGAALQDRYADSGGHPGDLAEVVELAEEAVRTERGALERPAHLVNLGTAVHVRYEEAGDVTDLVAALGAWSDAIDALPPRSPYRPAFLDRLALGHLERWSSPAREPGDLAAAIEHGRAATTDGLGADLTVYRNHLALALQQRWEADQDPKDLDEAIDVLKTATHADGDGARGPDLLANLVHLHLTRYELSGGTADLDTALALAARLRRLPLGRSARATVAASTASALRLRYEATGEWADLETGLAEARTSLRGVPRSSDSYAPRASFVAGLLYRRYLRRGEARDLAAAIRLLQDAGRDQRPSADRLGLLSTCLLQRYLRSGDVWDRDAAVELAEQVASTGTTAPHLSAALAGARHAVFSTRGSLIDLEEVVRREREALAAVHPKAPLRPVFHNNLGVTLQQWFDVHREDAALQEAVDHQERAVALSPPGSPDLPGLLDSLVAVLGLRYREHGDTADLDRAAAAGRRALALLDRRSPERPVMLANLGAVLLVRARSDAPPGMLDEAVTLLSEARRGYPPQQPGHAVVLSQYAEALALRHATNPGRSDRQTVLETFRAAVAGTTDAPVERIDVAAALGRWATGQELWPEAAAAYRSAADAWRTLVAGQGGRERQSTWLAHGEDLAVAQAVAHVHGGQTREAVTALESGRALLLAESLEARTSAARLRALGDDDLAGRYVAAADRLARLTDRRDPRLGRPVGRRGRPSVLDEDVPPRGTQRRSDP